MAGHALACSTLSGDFVSRNNLVILIIMIIVIIIIMIVIIIIFASFVFFLISQFSSSVI